MWIWGAQWIRSFLRVGAGRAARLLGEVVKLDRAVRERVERWDEYNHDQILSNSFNYHHNNKKTGRPQN